MFRSQIHLVGVNNADIQTAATSVRYFFEENAITEAFVELDYGYVRLMSQHSNLKNGIEKRFDVKCDVVAEEIDVSGN